MLDGNDLVVVTGGAVRDQLVEPEEERQAHALDHLINGAVEVCEDGGLLLGGELKRRVRGVEVRAVLDFFDDLAVANDPVVDVAATNEEALGKAVEVLQEAQDIVRLIAVTGEEQGGRRFPIRVVETAQIAE